MLRLLFAIYTKWLSPKGHGLKSIDLVCMKKLDTKVNIIPIIAKADTISKTELQKFKVCLKIGETTGFFSGK